ncbi:DUF6138 family protein [Janthinobacterium sp. S3M3]|uniref:DUF6138 family protein n=1 Tax=Janthinobacterium sp. S3M3 TaxID=2723078 RepID=UPI00288A276F|nr:DUF6138 family protein [Janthinobacterium sp. S3M3]
MDAYIEHKLQQGGKPTKPLESFFLTRHLLDAQLFPVLDVAWTINQFERIQQLNREDPQALGKHRSNIIQAILVACLRRSGDYLKLKLQAELEDLEKLGLLYQQVQGLESHEVERVLYPIWGKVEKLAALARKAEGKRRELLEALLARINAS